MAESKALLDAQLRRAVGLHQARRLAEAESAYREILAFRPDLAEIQVNCALAQLGQGKYGEAEKLLRRALQLRERALQWPPSRAAAVCGLGWTLATAGIGLAAGTAAFLLVKWAGRHGVTKLLGRNEIRPSGRQ